MPVRAVITDIDGTFLTPEGTVPDGLLEFYNHLTKELNVPVYFATGRSFRSTIERLEFISALGHVKPCPGVYSDGALILGESESEFLKITSLSTDVVVALEEFLKTWADCEFSIIYKTPHATYAQGRSKWAEEWIGCEKMVILGNEGSLNEIEKLLGRSATILVVSVVADPKLLDRLSEAILDRFDGVVKLLRHEPFVFHLQVPHRSKCSGVNELCEQLGLKPHEVIVLGDQINDFEMLRDYPYSVCMDNGHILCKEVSGYISSCPERGGWREGIVFWLKETGTMTALSTSTSES